MYFLDGRHCMRWMVVIYIFFFNSYLYFQENVPEEKYSTTELTLSYHRDLGYFLLVILLFLISFNICSVFLWKL